MFKMPGKKVVLLAGEMASGKSMIARYLTKLNYLVIDADVVVQDLYREHAPTINQRFFNSSSHYVDKQQVLALLKTEQKDNFLNYLYPLVFQRIQTLIKASQEKIIFVEMALAYQLNLVDSFDHNIYVRTDVQIRLLRLRNLRKYSQTKIEQLSKMQKTIDLQKVEYLIDNNTTKQAVFNQVDDILKELESEY